MSSFFRQEPQSAGRSDEGGFPRVEAYLETALKPIAPRADFVKDLRNRLQDPQNFKRPRHSNLLFFVIIGSTVAATALIVAGLIRLVGEVAGAFNILRLSSRQRQQRI